MQPVELLRQKFLERNHANRRYSLRAYSRDLGLSHGFLSQVFAGRKRLGLATAARIAPLLRLSESESEDFIRAVADTQMGRAETETYDSTRALMLEIDRFRLVSEWHYGAILELTEVRGFKPSVPWIARRLGLSNDVVGSSLQRLTRLGFLERKGKQWRRLHPHVYVPLHGAELAARQFHEQMIGKAREALEPADSEAYAARDITGITFAVDASKVAQARKEIRLFRRRLAKLLGQGTLGDVYQLNVQLFPLTRKSEKRGAR